MPRGYQAIGADIEAYIGADEIIGAVEDQLSEIFGLDEIIGAAMPVRRRPGRGINLAAAAAQARAAGGVLVRDRPKDRNYEQPLPVGPQVFAASATADVIIWPQRTIRVERLVIPSGVAPNFVINNITAAQELQFVAAGSLPAEMFTEVGVGIRLKGTTVNPGSQIVINFTNLDAVNPRTLRGGIIGQVVT